MTHKWDLSRPNCHVCGQLRKVDMKAETEWCDNGKCQVYKIAFSIPYDTWAEFREKEKKEKEEEKSIDK